MRGIAIDTSGNVWVTDQGDQSYCGGGVPGNGDSGCQNNALIKLSSAGSVLASYPGLADGRGSLAIDAAGNVWVAHAPYASNLWAFYVVSPTGSISKVGSGAYSSGVFLSGGPFAIGPSGNITTVGSQSSPRKNLLYTMSPSGTFVSSYSIPVGSYQGGGPVLDGTGNAWIEPFDTTPVTVSKISPAGAALFSSYVSSGSYGGYPTGMAIDKAGNAWVVSTGGTDVMAKIFASGTTTTQLFLIDPAGASSAFPQGVAIDAAGNVWVANNGLGNIVELNSSGAIIHQFTPPGGYLVNDVAIDASGNVWATLSGPNGAVAKISGAATGPQFFPYSGPQFPTTGL